VSPLQIEAAVVSSPAGKSWADGAWHHVVATSAPGMISLYLDGNLISSRSDTAGQDVSFSGYWEVGCGLLAWWSSTHGERDAEEASLSTFQAFLVSFVALSAMPPTVLQRLWIRLANEARRALGQPPGEDPFPGESFLHMLWREGLKAVRQTVVASAGLVPLLAVVHLLPAGRTAATVLAGLWAFYWIIIDDFELPMDVVPGPRQGGPVPWFVRWHRRVGEWSRWLWPARLAARWLDRLTLPWREEAAFTERHPAEVLGFGAVTAALLAVPVAGLFFRAVAIVGATALLGRLEPEGAPRPAPPPGPAGLPPPLPPTA